MVMSGRPTRGTNSGTVGLPDSAKIIFKFINILSKREKALNNWICNYLKKS